MNRLATLHLVRFEQSRFMTEVIHLVLIVAFLGMWLMIGCSLVGRHHHDSNGGLAQLSAVRSRAR